MSAQKKRNKKQHSNRGKSENGIIIEIAFRKTAGTVNDQKLENGIDRSGCNCVIWRK